MSRAYTSARASSRVSRFPSLTITQERRVRTLFSSDIYCSPSSHFPRRVTARHLYGGPKQGSAHGSNALFLLTSLCLNKLGGCRRCLYSRDALYSPTSEKGSSRK